MLQEKTQAYVAGKLVHIDSLVEIVRSDKLTGYNGIVTRIRRENTDNGRVLLTVNDAIRGYKTVYDNCIRSLEIVGLV